MTSQPEQSLYVLDTHILIWYFSGNTRLSEALKDLIDSARRRGGRLLVPTIVLAEALNIAEKGKVALDFAELYRLVQSEPEFEIVGFGSEVFEKTMQIQDVREIHDRIITATASYYGAGVLTQDQVIRASSEVDTP
ncbi:MAG: PIN domain-containing protein [Chloroflexi bacterium]|nr:PIN domain-containing protein [Chloroflexota bacterium]